MRINTRNILGGPDAEAFLNKIAKDSYQVKDNQAVSGGYFFSDNFWIGFWVSDTGETFVEDFDDKLDATLYAQGIQVKLRDGTWK